MLPFALDDARAWISLPFALPGLVVGIAGLEVSDAGDLCEKAVAARNLAPGASHQGTVDGCNGQGRSSATDMEVTVTEVSKSSF